MENRLTQRQRDQGAKNTGGHVAKQVQVANPLRSNPQGREGLQTGNVRAKNLKASHISKVHRLRVGDGGENGRCQV
jgi:hypothetical protein